MPRHKERALGARVGNAQFTDEQVRRIRREGALWNMGEPGGRDPREQAEIYGVGTETIRRILRRDTWNWLPDVEVKTEDMLQKEAEASQERMTRMMNEEIARRALPDQIVKEVEAEGIPEVKHFVEPDEAKVEYMRKLGFKV